MTGIDPRRINSTVNPTTRRGGGIEYEVAVYVGTERKFFGIRKTYKEGTYTENHYRRLLHEFGDGIDPEVYDG
jgi:hypothetical protein